MSHDTSRAARTDIAASTAVPPPSASIRSARDCSATRRPWWGRARLAHGLSIAGLGALLMLSCSGWTPDRESERPNLLVIMTDEHNFRTLGCYRRTLPPEQAFMWGAGAIVETPNIDWLARQGALCTSFYATSPVCSPSRAAFVSGRYPQNTGVNGNNDLLDDDIVTFAEVLRREGYATGYLGKWHLDGDAKPGWAPPRQFGFDDHRYMFNRGHWKQFEVHEGQPRVKARKDGQPTYGVEGADAQSFATDFLVDRALEFMTAEREGPFCCMLSLPDPHGPDTVRPPYHDMFRDVEFDKPRTHGKDPETAPSWAQPAKKAPIGQAGYFGMVRCIDDNIGKLITRLREHGSLRNTVIVFTSDHGDLRGEHHRHNKGVPLEASARVPFLLYAPGRVEAGTRIDEALGSVDFLPTILSLLDVRGPGHEEGRDASALFRGQTPPEWKDVTFLRAATGKWVTAVTDRYKLVLSTEDEPWLLDLEDDPDELINHATRPANENVVRELLEQLRQYGESHRDPILATVQGLE